MKKSQATILNCACCLNGFNCYCGDCDRCSSEKSKTSLRLIDEIDYDTNDRGGRF
jgi:hypothetical protein